MMRQARSNCPVNGMLLVIGIDSLIKDSAEQIEQKAGKIARQLDGIQRILDVRFPVYVVVTKCDLIPGFREFFDNIDDPQLQHQILGWSNPNNLDNTFNPDEVDKYLASVRDRLQKRRLSHLLDPVHTEDPQARRTDQVDELFALPDNLARIGPRLKRYLQLIFVAGEWSPKPLFLRGIYFTSSMREGDALDADIAQALGVPVDALPGGKIWDKEKSFFLRDLFMAKVFKEKGLVTRAANVDAALRKRKVALLGTGFALTALLLGVTVFGGLQFRSAMGEPKAFWEPLASAIKPTDTAWADADKVRMVGLSEGLFRPTSVPSVEVDGAPVGGRQVRTDPAYGHIFDHFAVEYELPGGRSISSHCRQIDGCASRVEEVLRGSDGYAVVSMGRAEIFGKRPWKWSGREENPYVAEHRALLKGITSGTPINEGEQVAHSTMMAIMGRMSAYTGKPVTWDQAMGSALDLRPGALSMGPMDTPEIARPGQTPLV